MQIYKIKQKNNLRVRLNYAPGYNFKILDNQGIKLSMTPSLYLLSHLLCRLYISLSSPILFVFYLIGQLSLFMVFTS